MGVADFFVSGYVEAGESVLSSPGLIWSERSHALTGTPYSISSNGSVWIVTTDSSGQVIRSTDDGLTWSAPIANSHGGGGILASVSIGDTFVMAGFTMISRSTDSGATWGALVSHSITGNIYRGGLVVDGSNIVAISHDSNKIYATVSTDQGASWGSSVEIGDGDIDYGVVAGNGVIVVGSRHRIFRSTDGGATWTLVSSVSAFSNTLGASFGNNVFIVTGGESPLPPVNKIMRSVDNGETWSQVTLPYSELGWYTSKFGGGVWILAGLGGKVLRSTDSGATWGYIGYSGGTIQHPLGSSAAFWAMGYSHTSLTWVLGGSSSGTARIARSGYLEAGSGIVEQGSNTNGHYVRFSSGIQECWVTDTKSIALTGLSLGGYRNGGGSWVGSWPKPFTQLLYANGTPVTVSGISATMQDGAGLTDETNWSVLMWAVTSQVASSRTVRIHAVGYWK